MIGKFLGNRTKRAGVAILVASCSVGAGSIFAATFVTILTSGEVLKVNLSSQTVLALALAVLAVAAISWVVSSRLCGLIIASAPVKVKSIAALTHLRIACLEAANANLISQAQSDALTGLLNRRGFDGAAKKAFSIARRRGSPVSLIALDIDHFKRVNDAYGHPVGDMVIRMVATALEARLRQSDIVARIGGEEFVVVLPDTDAVAAAIVANGIVAAIGATSLEGLPAITISAGVAGAATNVDTVATTLKRADAALYDAKNGGRNQVQVAASVVPEAVFGDKSAGASKHHSASQCRDPVPLTCKKILTPG